MYMMYICVYVQYVHTCSVYIHTCHVPTWAHVCTCHNQYADAHGYVYTHPCAGRVGRPYRRLVGILGLCLYIYINPCPPSDASTISLADNKRETEQLYTRIIVCSGDSGIGIEMCTYLCMYTSPDVMLPHRAMSGRTWRSAQQPTGHAHVSVRAQHGRVGQRYTRRSLVYSLSIRVGLSVLGASLLFSDYQLY